MKRLLKQFFWSTAIMLVLEPLIQLPPKLELVQGINYVFYELVKEVLK